MSCQFIEGKLIVEMGRDSFQCQSVSFALGHASFSLVKERKYSYTAPFRAEDVWTVQTL